MDWFVENCSLGKGIVGVHSDRSRYDSWIGLWKTVVWGKGMQVHISLVIEY